MIGGYHLDKWRAIAVACGFRAYDADKAMRLWPGIYQRELRRQREQEHEAGRPRTVAQFGGLVIDQTGIGAVRLPDDPYGGDDAPEGGSDG